MIRKKTVYDQIQKSGNLPTLPEVLMKLIEVCENDETSLSEIAAIVSTDPALTFRILQVVNSAFYGFRSTFTGIEKAVVYLGANSVKNIAVTASIHQVFDRKRFKDIKYFNLNTFWWQSLLCATLAKRIARTVKFNGIEEAYLSGLLHDIGRLVLVSTFPKKHGAILLETKDIRNELWAEEQLIGVTHCEAGAWLVHNWKLNSLMADAIRYHHETLDTIKESFPLIKIIYVANQLKEDSLDPERSHEAGKVLLGLDNAELKDIVEGATEEVTQLADDLNILATPPVACTEKSPGSALPADNGQDGKAGIVLDDLQPANDSEYYDSVGNALLASKVKNIALLSSCLENLAKAESREEIIAAFEQSMHVFFGIEKVLLFLPDKSSTLLRGRVSEANSLRHMSEGLVLPLKNSRSLIVNAFHTATSATLSAGEERNNLADEHILTALRSSHILCIPAMANKNAAGIILLGLPESMKTVAKSDLQLIQAVTQQVGMCLFLENLKAGRAEDIESERMAAISMTARKLAHEINNPLGIIGNYLTTMRLKLSGDHEIQEELGIIGEEIDRIASMINQVDIFSKHSSLECESTNINKLIEDILHIVRQPLFVAQEKDIVFRPDNRLPFIVTSPNAVKQILINLIKNASEAVEVNGLVEISTELSIPRSNGNDAEMKDGIAIVVRDYGPGLPETVMKNLYKPFVTTKTTGHSGLGLSIVHKTVKDLNGSITCRSKPLEGTTFTISLPLHS